VRKKAGVAALLFGSKVFTIFKKWLLVESGDISEEEFYHMMENNLHIDPRVLDHFAVRFLAFFELGP